MKKTKHKSEEEIKFYRNFGDLSDDSVVTDIYKKRWKNKNETKAGKCITRKATEEEKIKYNLGGTRDENY